MSIESEKAITSRAGLIPYFKDLDIFYFGLMVPSNSEYGGVDPQMSKGHIDFFEEPRNCAIREANEELGYIRKSEHRIKYYGSFNKIEVFFVEIEKKEIGGWKLPVDSESKQVVWLNENQLSNIIEWQKPLFTCLLEKIK